LPNCELTSGGLITKALLNVRNNVNCNIGRNAPVLAV
jgi:hypothetical protein